MLTPTIESERLILRRYQESDIDMIYETLIDERLHKYTKFPNHSKEEELNYIKKCIKNANLDKFEKWTIALKNNDRPIGNISVNSINKKNNYCNVGYVILYDYQGKGYASEALRSISNYLLNERKFYLVECSCNELNKASAKVMENAGFKKDGYISNRRINNDGTYSGVLFYSKSNN